MNKSVDFKGGSNNLKYLLYLLVTDNQISLEGIKDICRIRLFITYRQINNMEWVREGTAGNLLTMDQEIQKQEWRKGELRMQLCEMCMGKAWC